MGLKVGQWLARHVRFVVMGTVMGIPCRNVRIAGSGFVEFILSGMTSGSALNARARLKLNSV